jgi:hypothetical protein
MSAPTTIPAATARSANVAAEPTPDPERLVQMLRWGFVAWTAAGVAFMCWVGWVGIDWTGYPGPAWTRQHFFTAGMVFWLWMLQISIRAARAGQGRVCVSCRPALDTITTQSRQLLGLVHENEQLNEKLRASDKQTIDLLEQLVARHERHADLQQERISLLELKLGVEQADPRAEPRDGSCGGDAG